MNRLRFDFRSCLLMSAGLHASLFLLNFAKWPRFGSVDSVEIDLTSPFIGSGPAKLAAPKRLDPKATLPARPVAEPVPDKKPEPAAEPPKDWTLPGKDTKQVVAPKPEVEQATQGGVENGQGIAAKTGGVGPGFPYGVPNGTMNPGAPADVIRPKLLNLDEVLRNLRKFYPERERMAGHEGDVVVDIHLGADGAIGAVEIEQSAGKLFDEAAMKVAKLMRFEPARTPAGPVGAKVRKTMKFRLED